MSASVIMATALDALPGIKHAFFTRGGGASMGMYESNNCAFGSDDEPAHVARNRTACFTHIGMTALVTARQQHTPKVVEVEYSWDDEAAPVADALITRKRGVALGVLTADCAPVLLADSESGVVAAAHAGWKGACGGVLKNTVAAMTDLGADPARIVAVVGPCITQPSYEVGPEFVERFRGMDADFARYFTDVKPNGHGHFDLAAFTADRLRDCEVKMVVIQGGDTFANERQFFSYRRSVLRQESDYGHQLSAIGLAEQ